ncbi:MAG: cation:proton antiporter [Thermoplasmata archaeon]
MMQESELMFQLGAIMLLAFIAATLARRLNQTVMIGYIIIGVLIGPKMSISLFGIEYRGIISDTTFIDMLSQMGLIMLMFFVGLEFSFTKLKRTRTPAIILAIIDTSVGLFVGFLLASFIGWPLVDSIFLAGVVAMSSTSIAMKILFDLKRMSSPEVEFLIGFVVAETFIAMVILAVASGMIVDPSASPMSYGRLLLGMGAFYAFFVWVAMWAVPRVVAFFERIESDEMFILFALGIVFLTAGMASVMGVPPIIGAFFIGMILAETKVTTRIQAKLESFKDAFVAIFFTAFGMMIDPAMFGPVLWMVALAVPVVILYEAFVMSSVSFFLGFSARASTTIGTSMCGRGIESILYASVGGRVKGASMGAELSPFAGLFCFVMSAVTPPMVKHSARLADALGRILPRSIRFSGTVVSRTIGKAVMPSSMNMLRGARTTGTLLAAFVASCTVMLLTDSWVHMMMFSVGLVLFAAICVSARKEIADMVRRINYANIGVVALDRRPIVTLVSTLIAGSVLSTLLIAFTWRYHWWYSVIIAGGLVFSLITVMFWAARKLRAESAYHPAEAYVLPSEGLSYADDLLPEVPRPVYAIPRPPHEKDSGASDAVISSGTRL